MLGGGAFCYLQLNLILADTMGSVVWLNAGLSYTQSLECSTVLGGTGQWCELRRAVEERWPGDGVTCPAHTLSSWISRPGADRASMCVYVCVNGWCVCTRLCGGACRYVCGGVCE